MPISVNFEDSSGNEITSRTFTPGQNIRIKAHAMELGAPAWTIPITLDIQGGSFAPIYATMDGSIDGNATFNVTLPNVTSRANVQVSVVPLLGIGSDSVTIPIAIGSIQPANDNPSGSKTEEYLLIGGGILLALIIVPVIIKKL